MAVRMTAFIAMGLGIMLSALPLVEADAQPAKQEPPSMSKRAPPPSRFPGTKQERPERPAVCFFCTCSRCQECCDKDRGGPKREGIQPRIKFFGRLGPAPKAAQNLASNALGCDDKDAIPPEGVQKQAFEYMGTDKFKRCDVASTDLIARRTKDGGYTYRTSAIAPTDSALKDYRSSLVRYREACFAESTDVDVLRGRVGKALDQSVGYFIAEGSDYPWCSGAKIGRYVVTARHCFVRDFGQVSHVDVPSAMRFALFGAPNVRNKVRIATDIHLDPTSFDPDAPTEDWLVLELAGQDNAPEPGAVVLSSPTRWGELVIVGLDTNKLLLHRIDRALGQGSTTSGTLLEPRVRAWPRVQGRFRREGLDLPFMPHGTWYEWGARFSDRR